VRIASQFANNALETWKASVKLRLYFALNSAAIGAHESSATKTVFWPAVIVFVNCVIKAIFEDRYGCTKHAAKVIGPVAALNVPFLIC
jgi:hypothetical protein